MKKIAIFFGVGLFSVSCLAQPKMVYPLVPNNVIGVGSLGSVPSAGGTVYVSDYANNLNLAISALGGNGTVIINEGEYSNKGMRINLSLCTNITIEGQRIVNIYGGTNISTFVAEGANRYNFDFSNDSYAYLDPANSPFIYIRGGGSQERFIQPSERQPQHFFHNFAMRDFARLTNVASLPIVAGQWHRSNNTIRFIPPDGAAIGSRTIQLPERNFGTNSFIYGGNYWSRIKVIGVYAQFFYNGFDASTTKECILNGCRGNGNYNCGFDDGDKEGYNLLEFCEFGANNNDGVGNTAGGADSTNTIATIGRNLWIHDNGDEGWSDHQGAYSLVESSLTEYNRGGGITAFGGGRTICNTVRSMNNDYGFIAAGDPLFYNANWTNIYTTIIGVDCYTDQCRIGVGHDFSSPNLFIEMRNSWIGANLPFGYQPVASDATHTNCILRLVDCTLEYPDFVYGNADNSFFKPATILGDLRIGTDNSAVNPIRYTSAQAGLFYKAATLTVGINGFYTNSSLDELVGIPNAPSATQGRTNWLPSATSFKGKKITIFDLGKTAGGGGISNVWVQCQSGQTIGVSGPSATNITANNGTITLVSDGASTWHILNRFP